MLECVTHSALASVWHAGPMSLTRSVQVVPAARPLSRFVYTSAVHGGKDGTKMHVKSPGPHETIDDHRGICDSDAGCRDVVDNDNNIVDDVDVAGTVDHDDAGDEDFAVRDGEYGYQVAKVVAGVDRYRRLFGHTHIPTNFRVPGSQEWPSELHGYTLGLAVASLRHIASSDGLPERAEAALNRVGMVWDVYDWRWKHEILPALRRWAETNSTLEPPVSGDVFVSTTTDAPTRIRIPIGRYWRLIRHRDPTVPVWVYAEVDAIGFKQERPSSSWHKTRTPEYKNRLLEKMSAEEREQLERKNRRRRECVACPACGKNMIRASLARHVKRFCPETHAERHAERQRLHDAAKHD